MHLVKLEKDLSWNGRRGVRVLRNGMHCLRRLCTTVCGTLVPRPPLLLPSVCIENNKPERKTGEKRGRPGSIHHVSGREVDVGGEGLIFKYAHTELESKFLTSQDE